MTCVNAAGWLTRPGRGYLPRRLARGRTRHLRALGRSPIFPMTIRMPGASYRGALAPLTQWELTLREWIDRDVRALAHTIGERNLFRYDHLEAARYLIEQELKAAGYVVRQHAFQVHGQTCYNLDVQLTGARRPDEVVVIGAHYDSVQGSPGANDNASGVAAMLALARASVRSHPGRTIRFVGFVNEEPPYFQTSSMGSLVYARQCRARGDRIVAMLSLESIGYYSEQPGSQHYPFPFGLFYPSTADFIAFVGNVSSRGLVREAVRLFRSHTRHPSEGGAVPGFIPGVGWSDHWAFWRQRYPALMVTDTALFRDPLYHTGADRPDRLSYDRMARVVAGLQQVVAGLAAAPRASGGAEAAG